MKLISYITKSGRAADNRAKIEAVFAALGEVKPADLSYTVVEANDGEFLHMVDATPAALEILQALPAFREFSTTVSDRQEVPANRRDARVVGSFGALVPV